MPIICPSVLARTQDEYRQEMEKIAHFAKRIQIDLTDDDFANPKTVGPEATWWPVGIAADIHLMYRHPEKIIKTLLAHEPHMVIVHAEAKGDFAAIANHCHQRGVKIGVALLQQTTAETILPALNYVDHVLIFAGNLGHYGGQANMHMQNKIQTLKQHKPQLEIGWDGGINDQNISELVLAGVDVFNVGGYIQDSNNPERAFRALQRIAEETGTT